MPELVLFGACRTALVDKDDGGASLIHLLSGFDIAVEPTLLPDGRLDTEVALNAVIPLDWSTLALWKILPDDQGKTYEQKIVLYSPDGKEYQQDGEGNKGSFIGSACFAFRVGSSLPASRLLPAQYAL